MYDERPGRRFSPFIPWHIKRAAGLPTTRQYVPLATILLLLEFRLHDLLLLFVLLVRSEDDLAVERQGLEQKVEPLAVLVRDRIAFAVSRAEALLDK